MRFSRVVRFGSGAGLCGLGAVVAHAGPAGLEDTRWLALAAVSGMVCGAAILFAIATILGLRRRARGVARGDLAAGVEHAVETAPFGALVAAALVLQLTAHLALVAAGDPAHTGMAGSWALHLMMAVLSAAIVWSLERLVWRAAATLAQAIASALSSLVRARSRASGPEAERARPHLGAGSIRGRAPPICA